MSDLIIDSNMLICISAFIFLIVVIFMALLICKDKKNSKYDLEEIEEIKQLEKELGIKGDSVEAIEEKSELELVLEKMQRNLETKPEEVVEKFEKEQEEKAIISYQELVKSLKKGTSVPNIKVEIEEPVVEKKQERPELKQIVDCIKNPVQVEAIKENSKKFKNTDFISPVFGKMNENLDYPKVKNVELLEQFDEVYEKYNLNDYLSEFKTDNNIEIDTLENTLDLGPITAEIKKNEEFLQALKEFRENL